MENKTSGWIYHIIYLPIGSASSSSSLKNSSPWLFLHLFKGTKSERGQRFSMNDKIANRKKINHYLHLLKRQYGHYSSWPVCLSFNNNCYVKTFFFSFGSVIATEQGMHLQKYCICSALRLYEFAYNFLRSFLFDFPKYNYTMLSFSKSTYATHFIFHLIVHENFLHILIHYLHQLWVHEPFEILFSCYLCPYKVNKGLWIMTLF